MNRDISMFCRFTVISALLVFGGFGLAPIGGYRLVELWLWVFAFPVMLVYQELGIKFVWPTLLLNPFIYGAIWWVGWRLFRLMRRKRQKDKSPRCTANKPAAQRFDS